MITEQRTQPARYAPRATLNALRALLAAPHTFAGALLAVLLLRLAFGLLALPISAAFPHTALEQRVGLLPGNAPLGEWLGRVTVQPWQRYDAWNYVRIAEHGYRAEDGTPAFHPLYPLLAVPLAALLGGNVLLALLIVSTAASVALCVLFARYVRRFHPDVASGRAAWLLLLAPPGFILLAPYTEGLFTALAVACVWATRERRWLMAGMLGALATLTRQQGLALALPLAYALFDTLRSPTAPFGRDPRLQPRAGMQKLLSPAPPLESALEPVSHISGGLQPVARAAQPQGFENGIALGRALLALFLIPLAYAGFIAFRALTLGDLATLGQSPSPITFLWNLMVSQTSENVVAGQRITAPWVVAGQQIRLIMSTGNSYDLAIDLLLGLAMTAVVVAGLWQMHIAERLYSLAALALALCYYNGDLNPYMALPRHLLIIFPLFIVLARRLGVDDWGRRALLGLLLLNMFLAGAFFRHGWVP
jgi:hypothetical protein